jgi:hypothetical protein
MGAHSNGEIISTTSDFQTFWKNVAGKFVSNELVIFDTSQYPNPLVASQAFY